MSERSTSELRPAPESVNDFTEHMPQDAGNVETVTETIHIDQLMTEKSADPLEKRLTVRAVQMP